jgi:hypothetical protein
LGVLNGKWIHFGGLPFSGAITELPKKKGFCFR